MICDTDLYHKLQVIVKVLYNTNYNYMIASFFLQISHSFDFEKFGNLDQLSPKDFSLYSCSLSTETGN